MSQQIICLSGKKGSGKTTAVNFIFGLHMLGLQIVQDTFTITEDGQLYVTDIFGDREMEGIFDINRRNDAMEAFLSQHLWPFVKVYNFADLLKNEVCINILGLTHEQCWGTDEQKNSPTHLLWEDMPTTQGELLYNKNAEIAEGPMTGREVMQYVGTNIFRKMYGNVWVDATIRKIRQDDAACAIITDCRFANEVTGVQDAGGKVIRLLRSPYVDGHESETALDGYTKFDYILDNSAMDIAEQNHHTYNILKQWGYLPTEINEPE